MAFQAGDIEGRLVLDRTPFQQGLDAAKVEADAFERRKIAPELDVRTADADARLGEVERRLRAVDHKDVRAEVHVSTDSAHRSVSLLSTAILGLGPAALGVAPIVVGALGGLGAAFSPAIVGLGAFGAAAMGTLKNVADAATKTGDAQKKALGELGPGAAPAIRAFREIKDAWEGFQKALQPTVFDALRNAVSPVRTLLDALKPVAKAAGDAFVGLERDAGRALKSPFWQQFFQWLASQAGPAVRTFGLVLGNLAHGFAALLQAFSPIVPQIEGGLVRMSKAFADWASNLSGSGGFQAFLDYLQKSGPVLVSTLGNIAKLIAAFATASAPLGLSTLRLVNALSQLLVAFQHAHPQLASFIISVTAVGLTVAKLVGIVRTSSVAIMGAFRAIGTAASFVMANPIVLAIAAIAAAALLIVTHWKQVKAALEAVWGAIKDAARAVFDFIKGAAEKGFLGPIPFIISHWRDVRDIVIGVWNAVKDAAEKVFGAIRDAITHATDAVRDTVVKIWRSARDIVLDVWRAIRDAAHQVWGAIKDAVEGPIRAARDVVGDVVRAMRNVATDTWDAIRDAARRIWASVKDVIGDAVRGALNVVKDLADNFKDAGEALGRAVANGIKGVINAIKDAAGAIWDAVKSVLTKPIEMVIHIPKPHLPHIPGLQHGGVHAGGLAIVGEEGPELAMLPPGTRVTPHDETRRLLERMSGSPSAAPVTINNYFQAPPPDPHTWLATQRFLIQSS